MTDNITINEQSSTRIEGSSILYFDPFGITDERHDADIIFITHDHYDHFDPESIEKVKKDSTVLVAPVTTRQKVIKESGIVIEKCRFFEPCTVHEVGTAMIETIPAYNKRKRFHPKRKKWLGYTVIMDCEKYYVAGDTDANEDNQNVKCAIALVPIGGKYTMDIKSAAGLVSKIKPRVVIPTHYGSIVGKETDGQDFKDYIKKKKIDVQVELKL